MRELIEFTVIISFLTVVAIFAMGAIPQPLPV